MPRVRDRPAPPPLPDRPGRWKLLMRRQRKLLRPTAFASIAFGLLIFCLVVVHLVGQGPTLRDRLGRATAGFGLTVQHVVVEGRDKTPEALLRAAIGVAPGDPILGFSVAAAQARIETLSWVRQATIERQLPDTIVVSLAERRPFAVWQFQGKFVLIDRAGQVVADQDLSAFGQLPLVVGAGAPAAAAGLLDLLGNRPDLSSRVIAAVRVGERRWNLRLNTGADVLLPEGQEEAALNKLAELQSSIALLDRPLQSVDLRLPDRLVVRPQQPAAKKPT